MTMLISVGCWRVIAITRACSNWDPSPLRGATVLKSALLHDGVASQRKAYIDIPPGHSTLEQRSYRVSDGYLRSNATANA